MQRTQLPDRLVYAKRVPGSERSCGHLEGVVRRSVTESERGFSKLVNELGQLRVGATAEENLEHQSRFRKIQS